MSVSPTAPALIPVPGLGLLGEAEAMVCEGDVCAVPSNLEAHVVVQRLDLGRV